MMELFNKISSRCVRTPGLELSVASGCWPPSRPVSSRGHRICIAQLWESQLVSQCWNNSFNRFKTLSWHHHAVASSAKEPLLLELSIPPGHQRARAQSMSLLTTSAHCSTMKWRDQNIGFQIWARTWHGLGPKMAPISCFTGLLWTESHMDLS